MAQTFDVVLREQAVVGMNDRLPSHELPSGVYALLDNVLIGENKLLKRPGNSGSTSVGSINILGGTAFEPNGGTKVQIICVNGITNAQLYLSSDGNTFSPLGSANLTKDATMNFVQASNHLLGFNGHEVIDYDGSILVLNPSGVPLGRFAYWLHNYLFVAGVTGLANRLYWSALGNPLDYSSPNTTATGSGFTDVQANDGDSLTGLSTFNDGLVITKNFSLHLLGGFSGQSFSIDSSKDQATTTFAIGYGCPSHRSIVGAGTYLYYLSFTGATPHIRRLERTVYGSIHDVGICSYELEGTMQSLNKTQLSQAAGIFDGKYLYWALPSGSSTSNNLVIVNYADKLHYTKAGQMFSWVVWKSGVRAANFFVSTLSGQPKIYWTDAGSSGKVFVFNPAIHTDDGEITVAEIRPRDFMGDPARKTKWRYFYLKYDTSSAGTLQVNGRIDQALEFANQDNIYLGGSSPGLGPTGNFTVGISTLGGSQITKNKVTLAHLTGTLLGLQLKEATNNGMILEDMQLYGTKKGLRSD